MDSFAPKVTIAGLLALLIVAIIVGLGVGLLLFFVDKLIYLPIVFPIIGGAVGGLILTAIVRATKTRTAAPVVLCAIVFGIIAYGTYLYAGYLDFLQEISQEARTQFGADVSDAEIAGLIDGLLIEETGSSGLVGYLQYYAASGYEISRIGSSSSSPIVLTGAGVYGLWAVETLLLVVFAALSSLKQTRQPFCEGEGRWLKVQTFAFAPGEAEETLLSALRDGSFDKAGQLTQAVSIKDRRTLTISSGKCSEETGEASLIVERVSQAGRNTQTKQVYNETIRAAQLAAFERSVRP